MKVDKRTLKTVIITVLVTALIVILLMVIGAFKGFKIFIDYQINNLTKTMQAQCLADPLVYREIVIIPTRYTRYNKKLATILWDMGGAVSSSNCKEIPIPAPFNCQHIVYDDKPTMYGQFFWADHERSNVNYACLIFSGTYNATQWKTNMNVDLVTAHELNDTSKDTKIHGGFWSIYRSIREEIWRWLAEHGPRIKWLIISGRSLGGALSTICAFDLATQLQKMKIRLIHYTFASPRVGNPTFAAKFNEIIPNSFRVYNTEDVVVDLPPPIWRDNIYQHVGTVKNSKSFNVNVGNLVDNHIEAYRDPPN